jgi:hypothetical protein
LAGRLSLPLAPSIQSRVQEAGVLPAQPRLEAVPVEFQVQVAGRESTRQLLKTVDFPIRTTLETLPPVQAAAPIPVRAAAMSAQALSGADWQPETPMPAMGSLRTSLELRPVLSEAGFRLLMEAAESAAIRREESGPLFEPAAPLRPAMASATVHEEGVTTAPSAEEALAPVAASSTPGLPPVAGFLPMAAAIRRLEAPAISPASPLATPAVTRFPSIRLDLRPALSDAGFRLVIEAAASVAVRQEESGPLFKPAAPHMPALAATVVQDVHLMAAPAAEEVVAPVAVPRTAGLPAMAGFVPMAVAVRSAHVHAVSSASALPTAVATVVPSLRVSQSPALAPEVAFASLPVSRPAPAALLMAEPEALPPAIERPRLPALSLFAGRERLRVEGAIREDVPSTEAESLPLAHQPGSLATGAMLPALGSIFRHSKPGRTPRVSALAIEGVHPRNLPSIRLAYRELPMPIRPAQMPLESPLRIIETFHYLRPLESPGVEPLRALLRFWQSVPLYLRYASVAACLTLLLWTISPGGRVTDAVAARWGAVQHSLENRAAVELTDDFRTGLEDWQGATERWERSWTYDEAGFIRPGKLALYAPSMKMRDYRVEFMVQIDRKSSGWVFRAADHLNYYATKLTISKPGPLPLLSLVRYPVLGGTEGPKVEVPIRLYMHNNTPYRVQLAVQGNNFTTLIEGQIVDFWRDDKLQIGGFGFFSDTGARARVYWMKLAHQDDFIGRVCAYFYENPIHKRRSDEVYQ